MSKSSKVHTQPVYTGEIPRGPFGFFLFISKPYSFWAIGGIITVILSAVIQTLLALLMSKVITAAEQGLTEQVVFFGLLYPVGIFLTEALWRISGLVFGRQWIIGIRKDSSEVLAAYTFKHSNQYYADRFAGSLLTKVGNVSNAVGRFAEDLLWAHLNGLVGILAAGVVIFIIDLTTGYIFLALVVVLIGVNILLVPRKRKLALEAAASNTRLKGGIVDVFTNISATRQFVRFGAENVEVERLATDHRDKQSRTWIYSEYMKTVGVIILLGFTFVMFMNLSERWAADLISTGDFIAVMVIVLNVAHTLATIGRTFDHTAAVYGEAQEGLDELLIDHEIQDVPEAQILAVSRAGINWQEVTFEYGDNTVFNNFDLKIEPGQRVGLVGPSGAGKTTFVSLLLRQHDIQDGAIEIDGQNIAEVTQDSLRQNIAVVPQEPLLFHRTIRENIAYGKPDATQSEIRAVAAKAQALDFILDLPEKFDTLVGERGVKLSGGQKQRIAIARAMLKDAPILVLDEATSALDSESEVLIQKALHQLMEGKTVVAIAHRLSTLREMDRILVLENGQIVEDGTHETLTKAGGTYQRLWEHQAGGFLQE